MRTVDFSLVFQKCIESGHTYEIVSYDRDGNAEREPEDHVHLNCIMCGSSMVRVATAEETAKIMKMEEVV